MGINFLARSANFQKNVDNISQPWLVGVQTIRVMGASFLMLYMQGLMPAEFAFPAGIGDIAVGTTAPFESIAGITQTIQNYFTVTFTDALAEPTELVAVIV